VSLASLAWLCWCRALVRLVPGLALLAYGAMAQAGSSSGAAQVLWLTGEVTPGARSALVEQALRVHGLAMVHVDLPFNAGTQPDVVLQARLQQALNQAAAVWIDAPHPSVAQRLQKAFDGPLQAWQRRRPDGLLVWATGEEGATSAAAVWPPAGAAQALAAWLSAGGADNVQAAARLQAEVLRAPAVAGAALARAPAPHVWPRRGLYHPDAPGVMPDAAAWLAFQSGQAGLRGRETVAVLVHRHHFVNGQTAWLDTWLRRFAAEGMAAVAVFAQQADEETLRALMGRPGESDRAVARVLVAHQLLTQGSRLQRLFMRWQTPLLITQPYRHGDVAAWEADATGLTSGDVPFYLAQPEAAGGIDPLIVVAQADQGRQTVLIPRQADAVVAKVRRLIHLQTQPVAERRLVAMVYNYPPGGQHFGASFLNVPRSLAMVSRGLQFAGYSVPVVDEQAWIDGIKPLLQAYYPDTDLAALLRQDQAAALPVRQYLAWYRTLPLNLRHRIEAHWGPPERSRYVVMWQGEPVFVVPRMQVGHLAVLPQPPREDTLSRGQSPFMHRTQLPLSHHYLAVYLWARQADALIHFGTHGTQEWAPGKSRGVDVLDDVLLPLGDVPVVYPYIVDNLGEALTAKRRGRAAMVSHRTPVFSPAGFEARMAHMHELMHEWETVDAGPTRQALERQLLAEFVAHQLHRDLGWSAPDIASRFEAFLEELHPYLDSLAQSAQPRGLAVFGRVPDAAQRRQTVLQALRRPLIEALGEDIDEAFLIDHAGVPSSRPARWLERALIDPEGAAHLDLRPPEPEGPVPNRQARQPIDTPALRQLALRAQALDALLSQEGELPGLLRALAGGVNEAAYGGDPIRNPESLPTGRNLVGLDPSRLPTRQAYEVATQLLNDWWKGLKAGGGPLPRRLALSLWAGETLRHQGVMEAQALVALGVRPVWDDSGKPGRLSLVPLAELGRPRIDVLLSITGSYRDQFPALMALMDQAVALAAAAEPDNAIRRHTEAVQRDLMRAGVGHEAAVRLARARVFGNASGDYGTGLAEAVQSDELQRDDGRLGDLFLDRMSQPFVDGQALDNVPRAAARAALGAHLRQTQAALLSRSSHLYGMASSDDPFQYLGGLSAAARRAGQSGGLQLYVSQLQDLGEARTDTAQRVMALEMQARYLHPGWLKAQVDEGYAGTLQVLKAVQFTWGWQVMAPGMVRDDHWQRFHDVLVRDRHGLGLPQWLRQHPQAYAQTLERLIQADRHGHWRPDAATRAELARHYRELVAAEAPSLPQAQARQWAAEVLGEPSPVQAAVGRPSGLAVARTGQPVQPVISTAPAPQVSPPLQGWRLAPVTPAADVPAARWLQDAFSWALLGLWACLGAAWQARRFSLNNRSATHAD